MSPSRPPKARATLHGMALRRARILVRLQQGWTYDAIAQEERLSRERIRQIVSEILEDRRGEGFGDHQRMQIARLEPALRLAAEKIAAGDLAAIDKLLRVLSQIDKYRPGADTMNAEQEEDARARILAKLSDIDERRKAIAEDERAMAEDAADSPAPGGTPEEAVAKFFRF